MSGLKFLSPILLLLISNIFMTFAWYGHLKNWRSSNLVIIVLVSWGIAFFEYCFQVPANRLGAEVYTLPQLKVLQEVISLIVFGFFSIYFMNQTLKLDHLWATLCLVGAIYFVFRSP